MPEWLNRQARQASGLSARDGLLCSKKEFVMAHKKVERKKELDRRRKRRAERMKLRLKEARSGMTA